MLGLIKTELSSFARDVVSGESAEVIDELLTRDATLPEIFDKLAEVSCETSAELRYAFGFRTFERFALLYPDFIPAKGDIFAFLSGLERHVHAEMRQIYPDAQPPRLMCEQLSPHRMRISYLSNAPVAEMCAGMLDGALAHFGTRAVLLNDMPDEPGVDAVFIVELTPARRMVVA